MSFLSKVKSAAKKVAKVSGKAASGVTKAHVKLLKTVVKQPFAITKLAAKTGARVVSGKSPVRSTPVASKSRNPVAKLVRAAAEKRTVTGKSPTYGTATRAIRKAASAVGLKTTANPTPATFTVPAPSPADAPSFGPSEEDARSAMIPTALTPSSEEEYTLPIDEESGPFPTSVEEDDQGADAYSLENAEEARNQLAGWFDDAKDVLKSSGKDAAISVLQNTANKISNSAKTDTSKTYEAPKIEPAPMSNTTKAILAGVVALGGLYILTSRRRNPTAQA